MSITITTTITSTLRLYITITNTITSDCFPTGSNYIYHLQFRIPGSFEKIILIIIIIIPTTPTMDIIINKIILIARCGSASH